VNQAQYFREYRQKLGFNNQTEAKIFLSAKDVLPSIDYNYIESLNRRISDILKGINQIVNHSVRRDNLESFISEHLKNPFEIIQNENLLPKLNNQGRRPEEVLFSWLRGHAISVYFTPAFASIFKVEPSAVANIGDDDFRNIETFKRSPKADLAINIKNRRIRIEVQSGFQGINDIKEHKVREARRVFFENKEHTICIHVDVYNGQVAFVQLDNIEENDVNFVTRQQMEGQSVFQIEQNFFKWRLLDSTPDLDELELKI
jgi:hypothetical protein